MKRREFISLLGGTAVAWPHAVGAQQPATKRRLAVVSLAEPLASMREGGGNRYYDLLFRELRRLGHVEGQNLVVDRYSIERRSEGIPNLVAEVIGSKPDVIYAIGFESIPLKHATASIPIVALSGDPIASGLVTSLARPGGNVTGVSVDTGPSIHGKRMALLRDLVPTISRIAFIASRPAWEVFVGVATRAAAITAGVELIPSLLDPPATDDHYRNLLDAAVRAGADAVIVTDSPDALSRRAIIADAVRKAGLPAMYAFRESVEVGGLMAYGFDLPDLNRRAASNIDAILRGKNPGDIPYYQNSNFQLFINAKTASAMGLVVPPSLLARADEVIE
jgi:putative ABC transport system substrate-binding protein